MAGWYGVRLPQRLVASSTTTTTAAPQLDGSNGPARAKYTRREPEQTLLYQLVNEHLESFLEYTREHYRRPLPRYVVRAFRKFLRCGRLSEGFTRFLCRGCGKDMLVAHSCKGRDICSSCSGRRMAATAMHLVDKVLPDAPVRQWVLTVPWELRRLLAADIKLFGAVVKIFVRVVSGFYLERARQAGIASPKTGMVSFQQRFGASLNSHCHNHTVAIDGVYTLDETTGEPRFCFVEPPTEQDMVRLATQVMTRVSRMLRRRGLLDAPSRDSAEHNPTTPTALEACQKASLMRGRFERLDKEGRSQQQLFPDMDARSGRRKKSPLTAEVGGFSVNAHVRFGALDRKGREKIVRYCLRPAIATERLRLLRDGSIAYETKYPMRGRSTFRIMTPMEFMARLASLVAPPRFPLWRYSGVLAPGSPLRSRIVPLRDQPGNCGHASSPKPQPSNATRKVIPSPEPSPSPDASLVGVLPANQTEPNTKPRSRRSTSYVSWPELMRHTFEVDPLACPSCHGTFEPIAIITRREVIDRILSHLSLPLAPVDLVHSDTVAYDVTGEQMPDWVVGMDTDLDFDARAPPNEWDAVDPPAPDD